jgi:arylsulfatase
MFGNRALYHNGWVAGCRHGKLPWQTSGSASFDTDTWELYNIEEDFSQANDLAQKEPKKLKELQDLFLAEAAKYNVLPLDDRFAERADANLKPSYIRGKKRFVYLPGTVRIPEPSSPNTKNIDHTLAAEIEVPKGGAEGVLVCCGGASAGYALFIKDGKLHWEHNWFEESRFRVSSTESIPAGHHVVSAEIKVDKEGTFGTGGKVTLRLGEKVIGSGTFAKQVPFRFTVNETFDVGCDTVSPVSDLYESPFPFTGTIARVLVDVSDAEFSDLVAMAKVAMAMQ